MWFSSSCRVCAFIDCVVMLLIISCADCEPFVENLSTKWRSLHYAIASGHRRGLMNVVKGSFKLHNCFVPYNQLQLHIIGVFDHDKLSEDTMLPSKLSNNIHHVYQNRMSYFLPKLWWRYIAYIVFVPVIASNKTYNIMEFVTGKVQRKCFYTWRLHYRSSVISQTWFFKMNTSIVVINYPKSGFSNSCSSFHLFWPGRNK